MISIERLFCLVSQQAISVEPRTGSRGVFSREDAAGVIAMVQHVHPIGVKVLEAKIANNHASAAELEQALATTIRGMGVGIGKAQAKSLAKMAVAEVCGSKRCPICNGVGSRMSKRYAQVFECKHCAGTGMVLRTTKALAQLLTKLSGTGVSEHDFTNQYYDTYMEAIDELYQHEGSASVYAASILRLVQKEVECG